MYFVIRKSIDKQYYFAIVGDNHEDIAVSETYTMKHSAKKSIEAIKSSISSGDCPVIDVTD